MARGLTRHAVVMDRDQEYGEAEERVRFQADLDIEDYFMPMGIWDGFGNPEEITVVVYPSADAINELP